MAHKRNPADAPPHERNHPSYPVPYAAEPFEGQDAQSLPDRPAHPDPSKGVDIGEYAGSDSHGRPDLSLEKKHGLPTVAEVRELEKANEELVADGSERTADTPFEAENQLRRQFREAEKADKADKADSAEKAS